MCQKIAVICRCGWLNRFTLRSDKEQTFHCAKCKKQLALAEHITAGQVVFIPKKKPRKRR